jgi:hypothetical protein
MWNWNPFIKRLSIKNLFYKKLDSNNSDNIYIENLPNLIEIAIMKRYNLFIKNHYEVIDFTA